MSEQKRRHMRTPLARARGLGSAKSGTQHFWEERVTGLAAVPLTIAFVLIVLSLIGRSHAAVVQIIGSPLVATIMLLFIAVNAYHMKLGMQVIIEDYANTEGMKLTLLILNTFFSTVIGLTAGFAVLKISFGV